MKAFCPWGLFFLLPVVFSEVSFDDIPWPDDDFDEEDGLVLPPNALTITPDSNDAFLGVSAVAGHLEDYLSFAEEKENAVDNTPPSAVPLRPHVDIRWKYKRCGFCHLYVNMTYMKDVRVRRKAEIDVERKTRLKEESKKLEERGKNQLMETIKAERVAYAPSHDLPPRVKPREREEWEKHKKLYPKASIATFSVCVNEYSRTLMEELAFATRGGFGFAVDCYKDNAEFKKMNPDAKVPGG